MDDIVFAVVLASLGAFLFWLFWILVYRPAMDRKERLQPRFVRDGAGVVREKGVGVRSCPVCGEKLAPGALVKSKVYERKARDKVMHIYGCPFCWPENTDYRRVCPVCEKVVPRGGYLIARYFDGAERKHVHVLGCSGCKLG